jgi:hypothetical protein
MSFSAVEKEIQCSIHWFQGWSEMQKNDFLKHLLEKAIPEKVCTLFDAMHALNVQDKPPSIFQCQLKLFSQWFNEWTDSERNEFMRQLEICDSIFVDHFNQQVTETAGKP